MTKFLSLVLTGGVTGAIYSLLATGLTLTYAASGIFNFSHGAIAFTTAFVYYELNTGLGWPIVPSVIVAVFVFAPLVGLVLDKLLFRALASSSDVAKIIAPVGLLVALPALAYWVIELLVDVGKVSLPRGDSVFIPPGIGPAPAKNFKLGAGVAIDSNQLIVLVVAAIAAVSLWILLRRTRLGLNLRATVDRRRLAEQRGINTDRSSSIAWAIGTLLAGLAGVVGAPVFNSLSPATYTLVIFVAATAAVAGRLRSIPVAFVGGLVLGVLQNLVAGYATFAQDIPGFSASVPAFLLVLFLIVIGKDRSRAAGTTAESTSVVEARDFMVDLSRWRRWLPWIVFTAAFVWYVLFLANKFWVGLAAQGLAMAIVFLSFKVVTGIGGMVSLAQASFVTMSGLTTGMLVDHGWPILPAIVVAVLGAVALGMIVALPSMRLGGVFLALATLALALVSERILFTWTAMSGELNAGWTIPRPDFLGIDLGDNRTLAMFLLVVFGIVAALIHNLERSASGRAMAAVRSSEAAATASGIQLSTTKLSLFAVSSAIAGLGGVFLALYRGGANGTAFPASAGLVWLAVMVLFGVNRSAAALVAGLVTVGMPAIFSDGFHWPSFVPTWFDWDGTDSIWIAQVLFGLGAVQMARQPEGALAITARQNYERRAQRRARRGIPEPGASTRPAEVSVPAAESVEDISLAVAPLAAMPPARPDAVASVMDSAPALVVTGLRAGYGEVEVLHGVDLCLRRNSVMALLGPNGAGKSTLVAVLSGLVAPTEGRLELFGADITDVPAYRRPRFGMIVAPESRGIFPGLSVEENLAVWLPKASDRELAFQRFPHIEVRRALAAANLSGGEQQMLSMAPVVVRPPQVLIADEPTLGLAPLVADQVMTVLRELAADGVSILVIEEKAERVLDVADELVVMERGRVVWAGRPSDTTRTQLAAAYLGSG